MDVAMLMTKIRSQVILFGMNIIVLVVLDYLGVKWRHPAHLTTLRGDDNDTATTTTIIMQSNHLPRVVRSAL